MRYSVMPFPFGESKLHCFYFQFCICIVSRPKWFFRGTKMKTKQNKAKRNAIKSHYVNEYYFRQILTTVSIAMCRRAGALQVWTLGLMPKHELSAAVLLLDFLPIDFSQWTIYFWLHQWNSYTIGHNCAIKRLVKLANFIDLFLDVYDFAVPPLLPLGLSIYKLFHKNSHSQREYAYVILMEVVKRNDIELRFSDDLWDLY